MINKIHVGKRIAALRKDENLSQAELAERLGVTSQAVSKWECGGFQRGQRPHLAHDFAKQSVVCYTLCRRCRENEVAAGEGKGI